MPSLQVPWFLVFVTVLLRSAAQSGVNWQYPAKWMKGHRTCVASEVDPNRPSQLYFCKCPKGGSGTRCDDQAVQSRIAFFGLCQQDRWHLSNGTMMTPKGDSMREASNELAVGGGVVSWMSDGLTTRTWPAPAGAEVYLAASHYLVKTGTMSVSDLVFVSRKLPSTDKVLTKVCATPSKGSTASSFHCGPKHVSTKGSLKLGLFGRIAGTAWKPPPYGIVRTLLCFQGYDDWKLNDAPNGKGVIGENATVMSITFGSTVDEPLHFKFPRKYVWGQQKQCVAEADKWKGMNVNLWRCQPSGTKDVRVTAAPIKDIDCVGRTGVYIDYAFADLGEADWFAYGADVAPLELKKASSAWRQFPFLLSTALTAFLCIDV